MHEMNTLQVPCSCERILEIELRNVRGDLHDMSERVSRLESLLVKGVMLLVANLAGMVVGLVQGGL
jgi:hypothetical protein